MSISNYIENFMGIQDLLTCICEVDEERKVKTFYIAHKRHPHECPSCHTMTEKVHDYRIQTIRDLPCFDYYSMVKLRKRRYVCPKCGKRFYEKTPYLARYARMTNRMMLKILDQLSDTRTFTSVAREHLIAPNTAIRIFDKIQYPTHPQLPEVLSIDEFKGNAGGEKYNCILADPQAHVVLDILPKRQDYAVQDYLFQYSREKRSQTHIFISDMWKPYQSSAEMAFKHAVRVIDKYHWIRTVVWAFERVRKDTQRHLPREYRIYFKHSKKLLLKTFSSLKKEEQTAVNTMLYLNNEIYVAHLLKEEFWTVLRCKDRTEAKEKMNKWIEHAQNSGVAHMRDCARTLEHWKPEILNSFTTPYTNGFIEGCNNKIKVLKRTAYGYRNFNRFRNRILYIFSLQKSHA